MRVHPNGTVWLNSIAANQVIRLDPTTKEFTVYDVPAGIKRGRTASPYGMAISGDNKIWFIENAVSQMGRLDPATGKIDEFPIFIKNPVARKGGMDSEGNVWVGLHGAGKLMKIDYKTVKMTVYDPPTEDAGPYSVQGDAKSPWFGSASSMSIRLHALIRRAKNLPSFRWRMPNPIRAVSKSIRPIRTGSGGRVISPGGWDTLNC